MNDIHNWPLLDKEELFNYLRYNSYRSERYKLFYVATPKVACTSLKWWFAALEGYSQVLRGITDSAETDPDLVIHDTFHKVAPNVTGLMPEALAEALTSDAYFRFAVVRNPYKRIFSAWQSKLLLQEPLQIGLYLQCDFFRRPIECADDIAVAFEGFLEHLVTNEAPSYWDLHWAPQATLLRPDLINYSTLAKIENAKELSQALAERLGGYIPDPFASRRANESIIPYLPEFLTERSAELIRTLYAEDFETFGYDKQPPEAKETFSADQFNLALKAIALIRGRHQRLGECNGQITSLKQDVGECNGQIIKLKQDVGERNEQIINLKQDVGERNGQITNLKQDVGECKEQIARLKQDVGERNGQIASLNQTITAQESSLVEKEGQIKELHYVVARLKKVEIKLAEILSSKSWKATEPLRALRRLLGKQDITNVDPLSVGCTTQQIAENELLLIDSRFDAEFYRKAYPDTCGFEPFVHYSKHGKKEGRLPCAPDPIEGYDLNNLDQSKETIFIVSHEASRTGAPVLALNIAQHFNRKYNVIVFLFKGGDLLTDFQKCCDIVIPPFPHSNNLFIVSIVLEKLISEIGIKFAIVNSIVSKSILPILANNFVPSVCLIHEFASYTYPKNAIREVLFWASQVVFSARIVYENNAAHCEELKGMFPVILPQGKCEVPHAENMEDLDENKKQQFQKMFRPDFLPESTVVILGAGSVQLRKGVDLFLACAARVVELHPHNTFRFVWVGHGFDPDLDMNYSVYLQDQIQRSGLENHVCFTGEMSDINMAYELSDMLFLSSRLDPLPNVAIDAMSQQLPVICFDNTTGIADLLKENGLGESCVIPYLDVEQAAQRLVQLIENSDQRNRLGKEIKKVGEKLFDMRSYVESLERQVLDCVIMQETEKNDCILIENDGSLNLDFYLPPFWSALSYKEAVRGFVRSWKSGIDMRNPYPGFHPGIYEDCHGLSQTGRNPLAAFIQAGKPEGPWLCDLIQPSYSVRMRKKLPFRAALHIHVFFVDLFLDILQRLEGQEFQLDLLISVSSPEVAEEVSSMVSGYINGTVDIQTVPNRGRDIGPLLTEFSETILKNYDVIGHVHTKKSGDVKDAAMGQIWLNFLLENLIGKRYPMASTILERMACNEKIGLVFPDDPWVVGWSGNKKIAEEMAHQFDINELPDKYFNFPVGTMFWARTEAIKPLLTKNFRWEDYPEEPLPYDGTVLHALERLLPFVAKKTGYHVAMTHVPGITR